MFETTAVKLTTSKLTSTSASLLPGTMILISAAVVWRLWHKQAKLQTKTGEISNELKYLKKQVAKIKATNKADSDSAALFSSSLKKMSRFNPWSTDK